jgi:urease alpha subunit
VNLSGRGADLEVWEEAFDGGIPHMVVLFGGAVGFVPIWPTVVLRGFCC